MKNMVKSFQYIISSYSIVLLLYFSFFLANGGMENDIPFVFDIRGISETSYGIFWSVANVAEVILPLWIVYLNRRFTAAAMNLIFLGAGTFSCFLIGFTESHWLVMSALFIVYVTRIVFNFSVGNEINLAVPSEKRSEYFAVRDIFLYSAIAVSTFFSGKMIGRIKIEYVYAILSIGFVMAGICTLKVCHITGKNADTDERVRFTDYLCQIKKISKNRIYIALLVIQIASVIYSVTLKFIPLLAVDKGISISVFLKYTSLFTVVNCIGSLILAYAVKGRNKKNVYIFDLAFDILSALFFLLSENPLVFLAGYGISLLKDMFAPVSFGYMYNCIEKLEKPEDAPVVLGLLTTFSSVSNIIIPLIVGMYWKQCFIPILLISAICLMAAVLTGIYVLPKE